MTTLERVKAIIADHAGIPAADIADDAIIGTDTGSPLTNGRQHLGFDSLDKIEIGIQLGEHFGIDIPDEDLDKEEMGTPAGIAAYLDERLGDQPAPCAPQPDAPDYVAMSSADMLADVGLNADRWAEAFVQIAIAHAGITFPDSAARSDFTHTCMAWFANAIGFGYDAGRVKIDLIDPNSDEGRAFAWRKRPVEVQAVCFLRIDDDQGQPRVIFNHPTLPEWVASAFSEPDGQPGAIWSEREDGAGLAMNLFALRIGTNTGMATATPGDWIIREADGSTYPCKADIFAATYEPVMAEPVERDDVVEAVE